MKNIINSLPIHTLSHLFKGSSEFLKKLNIDNVSVWSVTPVIDSINICNIIKTYITSECTITDMTACIGGDTIRFAQNFKNINAIELSKTRCNFLRRNVELYKLKNVKIYEGNSINIIKNLKQDVIYIDPPWGGKNYKYKENINLYLSKIPIYTICNNLKGCFKYLVLKVPYNFNLKKFKNNIMYDNIDIHRLESSDGKIKIKIIVINYL